MLAQKGAPERELRRHTARWHAVTASVQRIRLLRGDVSSKLTGQRSRYLVAKRTVTIQHAEEAEVRIVAQHCVPGKGVLIFFGRG